MASITVRDVVDQAGWMTIPPCADPSFDHRTCDYWEDEVRGSKAHRASWLERGAAGPAPAVGRLSDNPFAPPPRAPAFNPFARPGDDAEQHENPFAPRPAAKPAVPSDAPRKAQLLTRGLGVFGSYAKVLEVDGEPAGYCQFGPLTAYPRASRVRELYCQLPVAPLPAVITCIATTAATRRQGLAGRLIEAVTSDLAGRGFAAVETYPEPGADPEATSAASPAFWLACGFALAVDDPRFPVMRREL